LFSIWWILGINKQIYDEQKNEEGKEEEKYIKRMGWKELKSICFDRYYAID
jgi:hypothetical protein